MNVKTLTLIFCLLLANLLENKGEIANDSSRLENVGIYSAEKSNTTGNSTNNSELEKSSDEPSEFPPDLFTEDQLKKGAVILHFIGALYSFVVIGIVCGDFFLPSIDCICCDLNLSQDVAAATFMSFATTAPELFIILISTFITKSDTGIGAVVGSGMFNILGVATIGGLAAVSPIKLDWWPLYRDSLVYVLAPIGLAIVVADGQVTIIESACLIIYYFFYFVIMYFNRSIRKTIKACIKEIKNKNQLKKANSIEKPAVTVPSINLTLDDSKNDNTQTTVLNPYGGDREDDKENEEHDGSFKAYFINYEDSRSLRRISVSSTASYRSNRSRRKSDKSLGERKSSVQTPMTSNQLHVNDNLHFIVPKLPDSFEEKKNEEDDKCLNGNNQICEEDEKDEEDMQPHFFILPEGTFWNIFIWVALWPATFILYYTIPDCRSERWRRYYPLTFLMCVFWIGVSSYFGTWMISVVGETIGISDSVMGLTFLALGGSMPEAISTFIMARQGEGGLGFSNSLGGNTMDICLCLGLPWLIKCATNGPVEVQSKGLQYNTMALLVGIVVLLSVATHTKFHMNKRMGLVCSIFYLLFIVISLLIELGILPIDAAR